MGEAGGGVTLLVLTWRSSPQSAALLFPLPLPQPQFLRILLRP